MVGFSDFQIETGAAGVQELLDEGPRETFPAELGCHCQVEQLGFVRGDMARNQESSDAAIVKADAKIVPQIIGGVPLGGFGTGGLYGGDFL